MMVKTKFGDAVRSKSEVAAKKKDVLCKILCHNRTQPCTTKVAKTVPVCKADITRMAHGLEAMGNRVSQFQKSDYGMKALHSTKLEKNG
jgi:hypothetical protein